MDVKQAMHLANYKRPVLAKVPISGDAENYVQCKRISEVSYVVPENGGSFWTAVCIGVVGNASYRVRIENLKEA